MSEQQIEISVEDQLLDAQMHVGRLENELALALKGIAPQLRWSTMKPAMSGVYLNTKFPDTAIEDPAEILAVRVMEDGTFFGAGYSLGPYWAGPLQIGGPE